jgi:hypothetical protein
MPFLIIVKRFPGVGEEQTQTTEVAGATLRIGRGTDNELHLEDHSVQLHHAVIQEVAGAYILRDLGVVSLTSVNGKPAKEAILTAKGTITIGPYTLRFSRPTAKAPLTIEYEHLTDAVSTADAAASLDTLKLPASPVAGKPPVLPTAPPPAEADATLMLKPAAGPERGEPDATLVLPSGKPTVPPKATPPAEADATLMLKPAAPPKQPEAPPPAITPKTPPPPPAAAAPPSSAPPPAVPAGGAGGAAGGRPAVLVEHPGATARRTRGEKIDFVSVYRLRTRYLNKVTFTAVAVLLVLGVAAFAPAVGKKTVLMPGAVSAKHASFVNECVRCHAPTAAMSGEVPDSTCKACHKSPLHFGDHSLAKPLNCTACHLVHKGGTMLVSVTGKDCLRCHSDLKVKDPTFDIHRTITDFGNTHPEFAVMVRDQETGQPARVRLDDADNLKDGAMIKLNHKLHLDPELPGLESGPLQCASCHKAAERRGYLMPPVKFEAACVQCHALDFDSKFADKTVPHGKQPHELDLYLRILYTSLWPLSEAAQAGGKAAAQKEKAWIEEQVEKAGEKLFGKKGTRKRGKCQLCHINDTSPPKDEGGDDRFPVLARTAIPERWFLNSNFNHASHTMAKCIDCHEAAPRSEATTDVLLPKAVTCRKCHNAGGTASASCLECHLFHEIPQKTP